MFTKLKKRISQSNNQSFKYSHVLLKYYKISPSSYRLTEGKPTLQRGVLNSQLNMYTYTKWLPPPPPPQPTSY